MAPKALLGDALLLWVVQGQGPHPSKPWNPTAMLISGALSTSTALVVIGKIKLKHRE